MTEGTASLDAVRPVLAALLIFGLIAVPAAARPAQEAPALPAPNVALPSDPDALAAEFTGTARRLRDAVGRWTGAAPVPDDVTLLALHHQRMLRLMSSRGPLGDATLKRLPRDVLGEARDTVAARRHIDAIPRGRPPRVRVADAAPAAQLRGAYAEAERRFGVPWTVLAAVNFVESAFGRVRSASEAGARGPMQFLPATWRRYGMGGDIDDPHDAILGAANLLSHAGARRDIDAALYAYNHSTDYVRAVRRFAARMRTDERILFTYYAWQVYIRTPGGGVRRVTGPR
jgi:membrane-bound lytic murein transglycosylase B